MFNNFVLLFTAVKRRQVIVDEIFIATVATVIMRVPDNTINTLQNWMIKNPDDQTPSTIPTVI